MLQFWCILIMIGSACSSGASVSLVLSERIRLLNEAKTTAVSNEDYAQAHALQQEIKYLESRTHGSASSTGSSSQRPCIHLLTAKRKRKNGEEIMNAKDDKSGHVFGRRNLLSATQQQEKMRASAMPTMKWRESGGGEAAVVQSALASSSSSVEREAGSGKMRRHGANRNNNGNDLGAKAGRGAGRNGRRVGRGNVGRGGSSPLPSITKDKGDNNERPTPRADPATTAAKEGGGGTDQQRRRERLGNLSTEPELRCPPEDTRAWSSFDGRSSAKTSLPSFSSSSNLLINSLSLNCNSSMPPLNVRLARPEAREGFRLVGQVKAHTVTGKTAAGIRRIGGVRGKRSEGGGVGSENQDNSEDGEAPGDVFKCYPLTDDDLWRSREAVRGDLTRLWRVMRRAKAGLSVNVVVLGGSVTHGGACHSYVLAESHQDQFGPCSWANRFVIFLRQHYQNPNIHLHSLAAPATTTAWILTHFDNVLKAKPDLLIVDYGVNDPINAGTAAGRAQYVGMMRAATELLIRQFLEHNEIEVNKAALVYVSLQRSWENNTYYYPAEVYYPVCEAYGIPVVSVRDSIWPSAHFLLGANEPTDSDAAVAASFNTTSYTATVAVDRKSGTTSNNDVRYDNSTVTYKNSHAATNSNITTTNAGKSSDNDGDSQTTMSRTKARENYSGADGGSGDGDGSSLKKEGFSALPSSTDKSFARFTVPSSDTSSERRHLWQTKNGAHPLWHGHQLTADVMSFAWVHAEYMYEMQKAGAMTTSIQTKTTSVKSNQIIGVDDSGGSGGAGAVRSGGGNGDENGTGDDAAKEVESLLWRENEQHRSQEEEEEEEEKGREILTEKDIHDQERDHTYISDSISRIPLKFPSESAGALSACPNGRYLSPDKGSSEWLKPSRLPPSFGIVHLGYSATSTENCHSYSSLNHLCRGWSWADHDGKGGWEYDLNHHHVNDNDAGITTSRSGRKRGSSSDKGTSVSSEGEVEETMLRSSSMSEGSMQLQQRILEVLVNGGDKDDDDDGGSGGISQRMRRQSNGGGFDDLGDNGSKSGGTPTSEEAGDLLGGEDPEEESGKLSPRKAKSKKRSGKNMMLQGGDRKGVNRNKKRNKQIKNTEMSARVKSIDYAGYIGGSGSGDGRSSEKQQQQKQKKLPNNNDPADSDGSGSTNSNKKGGGNSNKAGTISPSQREGSAAAAAAAAGGGVGEAKGAKPDLVSNMKNGFVGTKKVEEEKEVPLPGIISFPMRFKKTGDMTGGAQGRPSLLIEYLRSYANYGQAVVWVTLGRLEERIDEFRKIRKDEGNINRDANDDIYQAMLEYSGRQALAAAWANRKYTSECRATKEMGDKVEKYRVRFSPDCSHIRIGTWNDPAILDGHWQDRSSQVAVSLRQDGLTLLQDEYVRHSPKHAVVDPQKTLFSPLWPPSSRMSKPTDATRASDGVVGAEIHVMMVPWSNLSFEASEGGGGNELGGGEQGNKSEEGRSLQTRFKIAGLHSC